MFHNSTCELRESVKIVLISDIHANFAAIKALPELQYDMLWCLGDIVDYGPMPHESVQWVKHRADLVVRGNHDHAVGFDVDPQCSPPFKRLAAVTRLFTQEVCTANDTKFLRSLPIRHETVVEGARFYLVHAMPSDPLFGYCPEDSPLWQAEVEKCAADILLVGHTHTPFIRRIGKTLIVNPGSLGQPKTGRPLACYAVWEDGDIHLKEYQYPITETASQIREMPIAEDDQEALIMLLSTGGRLTS